MSAPNFGYQTPSDEMDFTVPPIPPAEFEEPTARNLPSTPPPSDAGKAIDQFFSTTTIMPEPQNPTSDPNLVVPAINNAPKYVPYKPKRPVRRVAPKKEISFHSVRLPETIYRKQYNRDNQHLPLAVWENDLQSLLAIAVSQGNLNHIRALGKRGADPKQHTETGETYLILATRYQQADAVRWLIQKGVPVNERDSNGLTALHYAAMTNNHRIANLLLRSGADTSLADAQGATALHYAESQGAETVLTVLRAPDSRS